MDEDEQIVADPRWDALAVGRTTPEEEEPSSERDEVMDDPRWDALASGTATLEEEAELRAWAERSPAARVAYEAFRPFDCADLDALTDRVLARLRRAEQAMGGADYATAFVHSDHGLRLGAEGDMAAALWAMQSEAAVWGGDFAHGQRCAARALELAAPGGKNECRALMLAISFGMAVSESPGAMNGLLSRLLAIEPSTDNASTLVWAHAQTAYMAVDTGIRDIGEPHFRRMEQIAAPMLESNPLVHGWFLYTQADWAHYADGELWRALILARRAAAQFEKQPDHSRFLSFAQTDAGRYLTHLGAFDDAEKTLSEVSGKMPKGSMDDWLVTHARSQLYLETGAIEKARALCASAGRMATKGNAWLVPRSVLAAAECELRAGRADAVEGDVRALYLSAPTAWFKLGPLACLAEIQLALGNAGEALSLVDQWIEMVQPLRMHHDKHARVLLLRAEALLALAQTDAAEQALQQARDRLLQRAARIGDPELRRSFLERVPAHAATLALCSERLDR